MSVPSDRSASAAIRVLIVGPPNTTHVQDFAQEISRRGAEVLVAGAEWSGDLPPTTLARSGIPVFTPTTRPTIWLRRLVHELQPDVVHAQWLPYAVMARLAGARPLVATAWGSDVYLASWRRRLGYRWLLPRIGYALADSQDLLAALRHLGAPESRSRVQSWGVDRSVFFPTNAEKEGLRRALGIGSGPVILSVRGFKEIYNPGVVIGAFEELADEYPGLQLVMKHNQPTEPQLPRLAFPDRVHIIGPRPVGVLADWFRAASVCVSIASSDSAPRSVWEAMACGCPCVVSDLPWAAQELRPGTHAVLTPITRGAVAAAVRRLLSDPRFAADLAVAASEHVVTHHDLDAQTERMLRLYGELRATSTSR